MKIKSIIQQEECSQFLLTQRYFGHSKSAWHSFGCSYCKLAYTRTSVLLQSVKGSQCLHLHRQPLLLSQSSRGRELRQLRAGGEGQTDPSTHPSLRIYSCSGCSHPASPCCRHLHCKVEKKHQLVFLPHT